MERYMKNKIYCIKLPSVLGGFLKLILGKLIIGKK